MVLSVLSRRVVHRLSSVLRTATAFHTAQQWSSRLMTVDSSITRRGFFSTARVQLPEAAPKESKPKESRPKKPTKAKESTTPKKPSTAKESTTPKKSTASKKSTVPKKSNAPKKSTAPKKSVGAKKPAKKSTTKAKASSTVRSSADEKKKAVAAKKAADEKKKAAAKKAAAEKAAIAKRTAARKKAAAAAAVKKKAAAKRRAAVAAKRRAAAAKKREATKFIMRTRDGIPKRAPTAYIMWFTERFKDEPKVSSAQEARERSIRLGAEWRNLPPQAKAPYFQRFDALKAQRNEIRHKYLETIEGGVLREINKVRVKRGKRRILKVVAPEKRRPASSFFRYLAQFQTTPEAQDLLAEGGPGVVLKVASKAAKLWHAMSEEEKRPYVITTTNELAQWKEKQAASVGS